MDINIGLGALLAVGVYLKFIDFWVAIALYVILQIFFALFAKFVLNKISNKIQKDVSENKEFLSKKYKEADTK